ncbi:thrombospondin type 3 repeat-containing protein [Calidithermus timidus]|uniref:thrombospondin type 3 repeat-containing protein n=1 Tax=Calidithermus timidus TaxID=307124 RepID=UPI0012F65B82|nr:thrombospondin type 3 repeat-containing protein [Calidithermus timidus]
MTLQEIIAWSDSQFQKAASWGSRVRWAGGIFLGSVAVYAALDYFYKSIQAQVQPDLDAWYRWGDKIPFGSWDAYIDLTWCDTYFNTQEYRFKQPNTNSYWKYSGGSCSSPNPTAAMLQYDNRFPPPQGYQWTSGEGRQYQAQPGGGAYSPAPLYIRWTSGRPSLSDWLAGHPAAAQALRDTVIPAWLDKRLANPADYANPAPGISLDPAPNPNQWWDDPYRCGWCDSDRDRWPDWMEDKLSTDPSNPNSVPDPNGDADGDGYTNEEERIAGTDPADPASHPEPQPQPDADQDGIPDSADPCPSDPLNQCQPEPQPDVPANPAVPSLPQLSTPALDPAVWDAPLEQMASDLANLRDQALSKFPFGIISWLPSPSFSASGCPPISLSLPGITSVPINYCDNPIWQAAATYLRPVLLVLLSVSLGFRLVRRSLDVQQ